MTIQRMGLLLSLLAGALLSACNAAATTANAATATAVSTSTPAATASPAPCVVTANPTVPLYDRPDAGSTQFGVLSSGQQAIITGMAPGGWLGFDPGVAQAANMGVFRLRWLAAGSDVTQSGGCQMLTPYPAVLATACYEMAMADTPVYAQPADTADTIATLPAGAYAAVVGKTDQDWYQVNLAHSSLTSTGDKQIGWIAPAAANFNGQSCSELPAAPVQAG